MRVKIHRDAQKQIARSSPKIKKKLEEMILYVLENKNLQSFPFPIKPLRGQYNIYKEALIDKDYRVFFRVEDDVFYIRYAGTHNHLKTG